MSSHTQTLLALDGHDAAGKTTLARRLAAALEGVWVRPYSGELGNQMLAAAGQRNYSSAVELARRGIAQALNEYPTAPVLVFDRHWMTVFTLVPPDLWTGWEPLPPTTLLWADLDTTLTRLQQRDEAGYSRSYHQQYLDLYRRIAQQYDCPIVRTDQLSEDEALAHLIKWGRRYI